jgi:hypothetical protein
MKAVGRKPSGYALGALVLTINTAPLPIFTGGLAPYRFYFGLSRSNSLALVSVNPN